MRRRRETKTALRERLARVLLAQGAFRTAGIMHHASTPHVVEALNRLIACLEERGDPRVDVIRRIAKQFRT